MGWMQSAETIGSIDRCCLEMAAMNSRVRKDEMQTDLRMGYKKALEPVQME